MPVPLNIPKGWQILAGLGSRKMTDEDIKGELSETELEPEKVARREWAEKPLTTKPSEWAASIADWIDEPSLDRSVGNARVRGFLSGAIQGIGNMVSEATSPAEIATAAIPFPPGKKVLHGSPRGKFDKFDTSKLDKNDILGHMVHFAEDPEYAGRYATGLSKGRIGRNPAIRLSELDIGPDEGLDLIDAFSQRDIDRLREAGFPEESLTSMLSEGISPRQRTYVTSAFDRAIKQDPELLNRAGYKGVRYMDPAAQPQPAWAINPESEILKAYISPEAVKDLPPHWRIMREDILKVAKDKPLPDSDLLTVYPDDWIVTNDLSNPSKFAVMESEEEAIYLAADMLKSGSPAYHVTASDFIKYSPNQNKIKLVGSGIPKVGSKFGGSISKPKLKAHPGDYIVFDQSNPPKFRILATEKEAKDYILQLKSEGHYKGLGYDKVSEYIELHPADIMLAGKPLIESRIPDGWSLSKP